MRLYKYTGYHFDASSALAHNMTSDSIMIGI